MPAITSENLAQAIVKLVAAKGLPSLVSNLVMGNLVNKDYQATLASAGDTVSVPIPGTATANNIAEGGSVQAQAGSLGSASVVLNRHLESTFTIPDIAAVLTGAANGNFNLLKYYMDPAVIAVAEAMETAILENVFNFSENAQLGAGNTPLTETVVDQLETALFNKKVPPSTAKFLVTGSAGYSDLRNIGRFSEAQTIGSGSAIVNGMVGKLKDINILRTQLIPTVSTTTYNLGFTPDAITLAMRQLPKPLPGTGAIAEYVEFAGFGMRVVMSYDSSTLAQQFTVDALFGTNVLRGIHGVAVLS
jgi:hypothetical protein